MNNPEFTYFMDIYEYADINDIRLKRQLSDNPALFFYRMWTYLKGGIPLFVQPKGMQRILRRYKLPKFEEKTLKSDGIKNTFTVAGNMDIVNIILNDELFAVYDKENTSKEKLINYNKENGNLEFLSIVPKENDVVEFYGYQDGYFENRLDESAQDILGCCTSLKWWQRDVTSDWLRTAPKLQDKNSKTGSAWQAENADTERTRFLTSQLSDKMQSYEQELAFEDKVPLNRQLLNRVR
ncbi:MAG: hypothetical protein AB9836_04495 [Aminipila sp.]